METSRSLELLLADRVYDLAHRMLKSHLPAGEATKHADVLALVPEALGRLAEVAALISAPGSATPP